MSDSFDTVIVGGGAAGLSAVLVLGRARRNVLLVDTGEPSNAPVEGIGGLLGQDGRPPGEFYAEAREHMAKYPSAEIRPGTVASGERDGDTFRLELADGSDVAARTVLLATGMKYEYPSLPGAEERWGHSVFHCPFCHGWEVRGQPLGVLGRTPAAVHRASLLTAWSDDVTFFSGEMELASDAGEQLVAAGIRVEHRGLQELRGPGHELESVVLDDGSERPLGGLLVEATMRQRSDLAMQLGAELAEPGPMVQDGVAVDGVFRTSVPGLWAAGDASTTMPSVAGAIASGSTAASGIVGLITGAI